MSEPEVTVNVEVEAPEPDPEPVAEAPAVESVVALVEHVEEDTPKWVENAVEHERLKQRIDEVERIMWSNAAKENPVSEPVIEEVVEEAVEEAVEDETGEAEGEVEVDIPPVEEEVVPEAKGSPFDIFSEIHGE